MPLFIGEGEKRMDLFQNYIPHFAKQFRNYGVKGLRPRSCTLKTEYTFIRYIPCVRVNSFKPFL